MFQKTIIAIGAAGLIFTLCALTEAMARGGRGSHGGASWYGTSSRDAGHNGNFGRGADRHHAHSRPDKERNSSSQKGHWHKSPSFGDNRHRWSGQQGEWHESSSFGDNRHKSSGQQGEWHEMSSGFQREWEASGNSQ